MGKSDIFILKRAFKMNAIYLLRKCDIDKRCLSAIYSPLANVVESTLHINPHAAQFAAYRAAGISLAIRQISQIREDLYRFSLSASSDKLNFPRGSRLQKVSKWSKNGGCNTLKSQNHR